ncbi:MAG: hypothetical protein ACRED0_01090 [Gammaproteobacteria bacterium]
MTDRDHNFDKPGYFVGIVTADGEQQIASLFPFSVGYGIGTFSGGGGQRKLRIAFGLFSSQLPTEERRPW